MTRINATLKSKVSNNKGNLKGKITVGKGANIPRPTYVNPEFFMTRTTNNTNYEYLFYNCKSEVIDVSGWDTSNITSFRYTFTSCSSVKELDLSSWDTSNITNMGSMFSGCYKLESLNVSGWDTSKVTNMSYMFINCGKLKYLDLTSWDTSSVVNSSSMFGTSVSADCQVYVGPKWTLTEEQTGFKGTFIRVEE